VRDLAERDDVVGSWRRRGRVGRGAGVAEGGKIGDAATEAARNTRGDYAGFVERAKEKAKERFEKMA